MEAISTLPALTQAPQADKARSIAELSSNDFFRLMISELTNQDPLEPASNQDLLNQISSIRDIELSSGLTQSLQQLTGEQRFSAASSMIGKFVTGFPDDQGQIQQGVVLGVRFSEAGEPSLQLSNGGQIPIDRIASVAAPDQAASAMVGQSVVGVDRSDPTRPLPVRGEVVGSRLDKSGDTVLELDSGDRLNLRDVFLPTSGRDSRVDKFL